MALANKWNITRTGFRWRKYEQKYGDDVARVCAGSEQTDRPSNIHRTNEGASYNCQLSLQV